MRNLEQAGWPPGSAVFNEPPENRLDTRSLAVYVPTHGCMPLSQFTQITRSQSHQTALSRCQGKNATFHDLSGCQAAATAVRHVSIAVARSVRCVWAEVRWRWTLKVL